MKLKWIIVLVLGLVLLMAGTAAMGLVQFQKVVDGLPQLPEDPAELSVRPGTEIYAATGERIYTFNQNRTWIDIGGVSPYVVQALLATEDANFYRHRGVDVKAVLGAVWDNVRRGFAARGGSTLTQQLVKRLFFSPEKTLKRKVSEMLLAVQLEALYERRYPGSARTAWADEHPAYKDRLLELYLNTVFYGANSYGIADAAQTYYNTTPQQLSAPQAALLMGLPNAPSAYNPLQHPDRANQRLQHVLKRMYLSGFLEKAEWERHSSVEAGQLIDAERAPTNPTPFWVEAIKSEVVELWGAPVLRHGSLKIHTTLDMRLQKVAEEAIEWGMADLDGRMGFAPYEAAEEGERKDYVQGALVCLDPHTGQVKAMVGGRDIFVSYYNRALSARRQPGSGFKPVAYLAALDAGVISPVSLFVDEPRSYKDNNRTWQPRNYGNRYLGLTTVAWGLINSANSTAVQVTDRVGPERIAEMGTRMGFRGEIKPYLSIALGVNEVTVLEMAAAYGTLAASGLRVEPTLVDRIADADDQELFSHTPPIRRVVAEKRAFELLHIMRQVVDRGTGRRVRAMGFDRPAAGKTGTTNDNTDAWFTGVTPNLSTSVWVGFDNRRQHELRDKNGRQITGGGGAAPIWTTFMLEAVKGTEVVDFERPNGVVLVEVDPRTGTRVDDLPDSLVGRIKPISVALLPGDRVNTRAEVLAFEKEQGKALVDSVLREAWTVVEGEVGMGEIRGYEAGLWGWVRRVGRGGAAH